MRQLLRLVALALLPSAAALAQSPGVLTFVNGGARVVHDTRVYPATAGLALEATDLLETGSGGFAILEFADGSRVALGGESRLMLKALPPDADKAGDKPGELALLTGWLKSEGGKAAWQLDTPWQRANWRSANVIARVTAEGSTAFAEFGEASSTLLNSDGRSTGAASTLKRGQSAAVSAQRKLNLQNRPTEDFVAALPRPFRDPFPALRSRFGDGNAPEGGAEVAYADVAPWLQGPRFWRGGLVTRFTPRLADAGFRRELAASMKAHPEWDRVVFPEKYRPRPAPAAPSGH
ncbi:hypothetical protein GRF61_04525 [Azoarcus sp. TTM-91]|uniref:FecR domain-containing protein n=1 Tax=Azoarcus sp. TTM-91 TaxID=2691581 RepID=UPI00145DB1AF|nr:FecR domain-containing protein [Azoarcus sp. TTM-91]NMG33713.1 hypothetical protein [Azoarcus sp. TTM-91]